MRSANCGMAGCRNRCLKLIARRANRKRAPTEADAQRRELSCGGQDPAMARNHSSL